MIGHKNYQKKHRVLLPTKACWQHLFTKVEKIITAPRLVVLQADNIQLFPVCVAHVVVAAVAAIAVVAIATVPPTVHPTSAATTTPSHSRNSIPSCILLGKGLLHFVHLVLHSFEGQYAGVAWLSTLSHHCNSSCHS